MSLPIKQRYYQLLASHNLRRSRARDTIFQLLQQAEQPLPLKALAKQAMGINRASVYRVCDTFIAIGLVTIVPLNYKDHLELAAPFTSHHHHISCAGCKKVVSLHSPTLEKLIERIAQQKGFRLQHHTLELSGVCYDCGSELPTAISSPGVRGG